MKAAVANGPASGQPVQVGAEVTLALRDAEIGRPVAGEMMKDVRGLVWAGRLDLSDLGSVRRFIDDWVGEPHILVNNGRRTGPPSMP